jgi:hypothetical protein
MSRHKSYQMSLLYQKPTEEMYENYSKAIAGKNVCSPPKRPKQKRKKNKEVNVASPINVRNTVDATLEIYSAIEDQHQSPTAILNSSTTTDMYSGGSTCDGSMSRQCDAEDRRMKVNGSEAMTIVTGSNQQNASDLQSTVTPSLPIPNQFIVGVEASSYTGRLSSVSGNFSTMDATSQLSMMRGHEITPNFSLGLPTCNNTQSNHIKQNIILKPTITYPTLYRRDSEVGNRNYDFQHHMQLQDRVKELEVQLHYENRRNEDILNNLREREKDGNGHGQQIHINNCVIL